MPAAPSIYVISDEHAAVLTNPGSSVTSPVVDNSLVISMPAEPSVAVFTGSCSSPPGWRSATVLVAAVASGMGEIPLTMDGAPTPCRSRLRPVAGLLVSITTLMRRTRHAQSKHLSSPPHGTAITARTTRRVDRPGHNGPQSDAAAGTGACGHPGHGVHPNETPAGPSPRTSPPPRPVPVTGGEHVAHAPGNDRNAATR